MSAFEIILIILCVLAAFINFRLLLIYLHR